MKFTITGFLIGIVLGVNSFMIGTGGMVGYYLAGGPLIDLLGTYMGEGGIFLSLVLPIILWTIIGYTAGKLSQ